MAFTAPPGAGVADHGALTGLADDDHPLYSLADGTRGVLTEIASATAADDVSISFSGLSDANQLLILLCRRVVPASDAVAFQLQFLSGSVDKGTVSMIADVGSDVGEHCGCLLYFDSLESVALTGVVHAQAFRIRSTGGITQVTTSGIATDQTAIDEVIASFDSGNIESGDLRLFALVH